MPPGTPALIKTLVIILHDGRESRTAGIHDAFERRDQIVAVDHNGRDMIRVPKQQARRWYVETHKSEE